MGRDSLDDLEADESLLSPDEQAVFNADVGIAAALGRKPIHLPAHIVRSHKMEEDEWNFSILTAAKDRLSLKVGSKEKARQKRTRLYNARTYLRYVERMRLKEIAYEGPLDDWTLMLEENDGVWYVVALNIKLNEGWQEG